MDEALRMDCLQSGRDGRDDRPHFVEAHARDQALLQVPATQILHGQVVVIVDNAALVDMGEIVVLEAGGDVALLLQGIEECARDIVGGGDDLDGDLAFRVLLLGKIDRAHAAPAQHRKQPEIAQPDVRKIALGAPVHPAIQPLAAVNCQRTSGP